MFHNDDVMLTLVGVTRYALVQRCRSKLDVFGVDHLRVSGSPPSLPPSPFFPTAPTPRVNPGRRGRGREGGRGGGEKGEGEGERRSCGVNLPMNACTLTEAPETNSETSP